MPRILVSIILFAILSFPLCALSTATAADPAFQKRITSDAKYFVIMRANLQRATAFAGSRPDLFCPAAERVQGDVAGALG